MEEPSIAFGAAVLKVMPASVESLLILYWEHIRRALATKNLLWQLYLVFAVIQATSPVNRCRTVVVLRTSLVALTLTIKVFIVWLVRDIITGLGGARTATHIGGSNKA